jgi:hypothetical protein
MMRVAAFLSIFVLANSNAHDSLSLLQTSAVKGHVHVFGKEECKAARVAFKDKRAAAKIAKQAVKDARAAFMLVKGEVDMARAAAEGACPERKSKAPPCTAESCPISDDTRVKCGTGWYGGHGAASGPVGSPTGLIWIEVNPVNTDPANADRNMTAEQCIKAAKKDPRCKDADTVSFGDPRPTSHEGDRLKGFCMCNGHVQVVAPSTTYLVCSLRDWCLNEQLPQTRHGWCDKGNGHGLDW